MHLHWFIDVSSDLVICVRCIGVWNALYLCMSKACTYLHMWYNHIITFCLLPFLDRCMTFVIYYCNEIQFCQTQPGLTDCIDAVT